VACCATAVLDAAPPVIWFIRHHMRSHRKGLSLPAFRTLAMVDQQPAVSLSAVAEHLGCSLSAASRCVGGLVNKEFLARTGCRGDRRQMALAITPHGRAVLDVAWSATQREMEAQLGKLPATQQAKLAAGMGVLQSVFGSMGLATRISCAAARPPLLTGAPQVVPHQKRLTPRHEGAKKWHGEEGIWKTMTSNFQLPTSNF